MASTAPTCKEQTMQDETMQVTMRETTRDRKQQFNATTLGKLPAELRNHIYEAALVQRRPIGLGTFKRTKYATRRAYPYCKREVARMGTLLQTCSHVRDETTKMYYQCNSFHAKMQLEDFGELATWLETVVGGQSGPTLTIDLDITIDRPRGTWRHFHHVLPLVRMFYRTGLKLKPTPSSQPTVTQDQGHQEPPSPSQQRKPLQWYSDGEAHRFGTLVSPGKPMRNAINIAMQIGQQGAKERLTTSKFEERLAEFLRLVYTDTGVLRCCPTGCDLRLGDDWLNSFVEDEVESFTRRRHDMLPVPSPDSWDWSERDTDEDGLGCVL